MINPKIVNIFSILLPINAFLIVLSVIGVLLGLFEVYIVIILWAIFMGSFLIFTFFMGLDILAEDKEKIYKLLKTKKKVKE